MAFVCAMCRIPPWSFEAKVPEWSKDWLQQLERQADLDPDTIFGCKVPNLGSVVVGPSMSLCVCVCVWCECWITTTCIA